MDCSSCGAVVTEILASHDYTIEWNSETEQWVKHMGSATYSCSNCLEEFNTEEIQEILKQVDEL